MINKELEELAGISEKDYVDCPYSDDCEVCSLGLTVETCEELYEQYLLTLI
jgi:hypothetical protein